MKIYRGKKTKSGKFEFVRQIKTIKDLTETLYLDKSIWSRHRMMPSAFVKQSRLKYLMEFIKLGHYWKMKEVC